MQDSKYSWLPLPLLLSQEIHAQRVRNQISSPVSSYHTSSPAWTPSRFARKASSNPLRSALPGDGVAACVQTSLQLQVISSTGLDTELQQKHSTQFKPKGFPHGGNLHYLPPQTRSASHFAGCCYGQGIVGKHKQLNRKKK